jgi:hypothetical protein
MHSIEQPLDYFENFKVAFQCGPWLKCKAAINYNNHVSAQHPEAAAFVCHQVLEKVYDKLCHLVSWDDNKDNPLANLKISPLAAIPHKSRQFRTMLDCFVDVALLVLFHQSC